MLVESQLTFLSARAKRHRLSRQTGNWYRVASASHRSALSAGCILCKPVWREISCFYHSFCLYFPTCKGENMVILLSWHLVFSSDRPAS